jgi:hypothetical protein
MLPRKGDDRQHVQALPVITPVHVLVRHERPRRAVA